jgi:hypothetical protein
MSDPGWMVRAKAALSAFRASPELFDHVKAEVDAFFVAYPEEPRDALNEDLIMILVFERLTAEPETTNQ